MNTALATSIFRLYTCECFYPQIPITNLEERKDVHLGRYTLKMEEAIGFLSTKAKETDLEGFDLQKPWVCRDHTADGEQDAEMIPETFQEAILR